MGKEIKYCQEFFSKNFVANTMKEAYLKACKWYATTVLSKNELKDVLVEYVKNENSANQLPSITVKLYAHHSPKEIKDMHCKACSEAHKFYFLNDVHCNNCNIHAYQRRVIESVQIKSSSYLEKLYRKDEK